MTTTADLGLFGPDSVSWRVHREPILWLAGLRVLYLQALHPRAVAGVVQNSDYQRDSWSRLWRTAEYVATVVYGTTDEAEKAGRRVRAIHKRLTATDSSTGEIFRIDEPDLLRWIHVTEVESFVTTARRAGLQLSDDDIDSYYAEQVRAAELVGLEASSIPSSQSEIDDYYRDIRPELALTKDARDVAKFLTAPPMHPALQWTIGRPLWFWVASTSFALLPRWARRMYRMPGFPTTDIAVAMTTRSLRALINALPIKDGPIYRDAIARTTTPTTLPPR